MKYLIAGGTGFVGQALISYLFNRGHEVSLLTRGSKAPKFSGGTPEAFQWDGKSPGAWHEGVEQADVVINLCGESVVNTRWSDAVKKRLSSSRTAPTRALVNAIRNASRKPCALINASAVGYYGNSGDTILTESSGVGSDYLAELCEAWEESACRASADGIRVVLLRIGVVLGSQGGVIQKMRMPFSLYTGGPLGSGKQWVPWIHISDLIRIIERVSVDSRISGPCNACSPDPETMTAFSAAMGRAMNRPSWLQAPEFALKILLGERASVITSSYRAIPDKMLKQNFKFDYEKLDSAMEAVVRENL